MHSKGNQPELGKLRIAWIISQLTAGGIGPVCRYAAEGMARLGGCYATVVSLHDPTGDHTDPVSGVRFASLGLGEIAARQFLEWLKRNPQDIVITNDVCWIEPAFPYIPPETFHIIQIHDFLKRYRDVAVRHQAWVDGICCVGRHIEVPLRSSLEAAGYQGVLSMVHNGAAFPPMPKRKENSGPIRLLFMGRLDPFKGIFDLVPILRRLKRLETPAALTIVGGEHELLARRFKREGLDHLVTWAGWLEHEECYRLAAENDLFLMLSRKEPFGMVTIEAMSMGCVPIAYDVPSGSTEIIEHGKSGCLLPLGNFGAIAREIKKLYEDRQWWSELSAGAVSRARTEFSQEALASRVTKFLERVRANAIAVPSRREVGFPANEHGRQELTRLRYQRLSPGLRAWLRNRLGACPRLSYWLASRWSQ